MLKKSYVLVENSSRKLSAALKGNGGSCATVGGRRKKAWSNCSSQYQRKKRRQIARDVQTALSFTHTSALTKRARELDADYTVCPTPGTVVGVQQSLKEQLKKRIQILVKGIPTLAQNATGDGTRISHSMHAVIIAFVVVEEGANPNSPRGNHTIAILNAGENYEVLSNIGRHTS